MTAAGPEGRTSLRCWRETLWQRWSQLELRHEPGLQWKRRREVPLLHHHEHLLMVALRRQPALALDVLPTAVGAQEADRRQQELHKVHQLDFEGQGSQEEGNILQKYVLKQVDGAHGAIDEGDEDIRLQPVECRAWTASVEADRGQQKLVQAVEDVSEADAGDAEHPLEEGGRQDARLQTARRELRQRGYAIQAQALHTALGDAEQRKWAASHCHPTCTGHAADSYE